jgi:hypothetical protein
MMLEAELSCANGTHDLDILGCGQTSRELEDTRAAICQKGGPLSSLSLSCSEIIERRADHGDRWCWIA